MSKFDEFTEEIRKEIRALKKAVVKLDASPLMEARHAEDKQTLLDEIADLTAKLTAFEEKKSTEENDHEKSPEKDEPQPKKKGFRFFKD